MVRRKLYFVAALVPGKWRPRNPRVVDEDIERPVRFQKRSGKAVDGARLARSNGITSAFPIFSRLALAFLTSRAPTTTARAFERTRVVSRPIPEWPPVTTATFPRRSRPPSASSPVVCAPNPDPRASVRSVCSFIGAFAVVANPDGLYLLSPKRYESPGDQMKQPRRRFCACLPLSARGRA